MVIIYINIQMIQYNLELICLTSQYSNICEIIDNWLLLCQNFADDWYRFGDSTAYKMPESCVDIYHCGSKAPIWLNGTHPTGQHPYHKNSIQTKKTITVMLYKVPNYGTCIRHQSKEHLETIDVKNFFTFCIIFY